MAHRAQAIKSYPFIPLSVSSSVAPPLSLFLSSSISFLISSILYSNPFPHLFYSISLSLSVCVCVRRHQGSVYVLKITELVTHSHTRKYTHFRKTFEMKHLATVYGLCVCHCTTKQKSVWISADGRFLISLSDFPELTSKPYDIPESFIVLAVSVFFYLYRSNCLCRCFHNLYTSRLKEHEVVS